MRQEVIKCDRKNSEVHGFYGKRSALSSFVLSNVNSCPLVWHYRFSKSLKKNEKIQERALRILYHDSTSNYKELLNKSSKVSMEEKRLRNFSLEISKTFNQLSLEYMKEIFHKTTNLTERTFNIKANQHNITKYGNKSSRSSNLEFLVKAD